MPQIPANVNPGDLITAYFFNSTLAVLADHEARIAQLEALATTASGVAITQVVPSTIHPGDQIQLLGRNFGVTTLNNVTISGVQVTTFNTAQSSNTLLTLTVPTIVGIPTQGMTAAIALSNPSGSATANVLLLPSQAALPLGVIQVAESQVSQAAAVTAGQEIIITYTVTGVTSQNETYDVSATVDSGWAAVLVDSSHNPIVPSQITIPAGSPPQGVNIPFLIQVSVPGGLANGVAGNLNVGVVSVLNPAKLNASTNQPYALTIGTPPPGPQNNVVIQLTGVLQPGSQTGTAISVPANNALVTADFQATLKNADTYIITSPPVFANPTGWNATIFGGTKFTTTTGGQAQNFQIALIAAPGAAATAMTITITSATNSTVTGLLNQPVQPA
jgi:hypothetical protein